MPVGRAPPFGDIVTPEGGHRDGGEGRQADLSGKGRELGGDLVEDGLGPVHKVHLVHRQHHMPDAQELDQIGVPAGLSQNPAPGVNQDDRRISGRGTGHHVPGVLLVPGRISDDELAAVCREEAVGDIDGDALLAFRRQAVDQEGEVDLATLRPDPTRVGLQRRELVLEDHLGVVEQPPDQGGLAVVHRAAGQEPQEALGLVGLQVGLDVGSDEVGLVGHQK